MAPLQASSVRAGEDRNSCCATGKLEREPVASPAANGPAASLRKVAEPARQLAGNQRAEGGKTNAEENIRLKANGRSGSRVRLATAGERQTAQKHRVIPVRSRESELRGLGKKTNTQHGENHRAQQTAQPACDGCRSVPRKCRRE